MSKTLIDLLQQFPTRAQATRIPQRTDDTGDNKWNRTARHWHITLTAHDAGSNGEGYLMPPRASIAVEYSQGSAHTARPTVNEVVSALLSDASFVASCHDVDDFAAEMGIEKPSEALRTWEACKDAARKLATLYGPAFDPSDIDTEGE